jgi:tetratricopeptide (TPR) repeat protein
VALTDPELDLLREMLEEDPAAHVFVQVGEELVRRGRWRDAVDVLAAGLARCDEDGPSVGYALLARAALEAGAFSVALEAVGALGIDPESQPELSRIEILALERAGRLGEARSRVDRFLDHDPTDVVVTSVLERLSAPPPARRARAVDPFYTVERAEAYVDLGRTDRALRVYRRILQANREDPSLELRVRQLITAPQRVPDDLSVELTDPGLVPEEPDLRETPAPAPLSMPQPGLSASVQPRSKLIVGGPRSGLGAHTDLEAQDDPEDLTATPVARPREVHRPRFEPTGFADDPDADEGPTQLLRVYDDGTGSSAPSERPEVRQTPAVPPIDRRVQPPQRLGDRFLPEAHVDDLHDLEDDLPTVKARRFGAPDGPVGPESPGPGSGERAPPAERAPELGSPALDGPLGPGSPALDGPAPDPEPPRPRSAGAEPPPEQPPHTGDPQGRPPEPGQTDLDLLQGTETEWSTGEDRPSRRLLRR